MELLLESDLMRLEAQDPYHPSRPGCELSSDKLIVIVKFFTPDADWTWFACSASKDPKSGDVQFFGLVEGLETELGYFWLSELKKYRGRFNLPIERDLYWREKTLKEVMKEVNYAYIT